MWLGVGRQSAGGCGQAACGQAACAWARAGSTWDGSVWVGTGRQCRGVWYQGARQAQRLCCTRVGDIHMHLAFVGWVHRKIEQTSLAGTIETVIQKKSRCLSRVLPPITDERASGSSTQPLCCTTSCCISPSICWGGACTAGLPMHQMPPRAQASKQKIQHQEKDSLPTPIFPCRGCGQWPTRRR